MIKFIIYWMVILYQMIFNLSKDKFKKKEYEDLLLKETKPFMKLKLTLNKDLK